MVLASLIKCLDASTPIACSFTSKSCETLFAMNEEIMQIGVAVMQQLSASRQPVSAARICKALGVRMSSLQRCLAYLGEQRIAGQDGLGLIAATQEEERLMLSLTAVGQAQWQAWQQEGGTDQSVDEDDA